MIKSVKVEQAFRFAPYVCLLACRHTPRVRKAVMTALIVSSALSIVKPCTFAPLMWVNLSFILIPVGHKSRQASQVILRVHSGAVSSSY